MTTFTHFTDPYRSQVGVVTPVVDVFAPVADAFVGWDDGVEGLDEQDFALLVRTVELVVQASAFSSERLEYALRISAATAARLTRSLEKLGVIAKGGPTDERVVLIGIRGLPILQAKLFSGGSARRRPCPWRARVRAAPTTSAP
ncbi:MAG: hypothetical protein WDM88_13380 [Galbitalea sp.]